MKRTRAVGLAASGALLATGVAVVSLGSVGASDINTDFVELVTPEYVTFGFESSTGRAFVQYTGPEGKDPILVDKTPGITATTVDDTNNKIYLAVDSRCTVINRDEVAQLLRLQAGNREDRVQLYENGLGTGRDRCTPADGRIADTSFLRFLPGDALWDDDGKGTTAAVAVFGKFTGARLNVEGKFETELEYLFDDGTASFEPLGGGAGDNGNDSNGDNYLIPITSTSAFQTLDVTAKEPTSGNRAEIAIDNGGDSDDGDAGTVFYFGGKTYEYTVDCGDEVSETFTLDGSPAIKVTYLRLENRPRGDSGIDYGPCAPIGLQIDFDPAGANDGEPRDATDVLNSSASADGVPQAVRARVKIEWLVPRLEANGDPRLVDDLELELQREISYPEIDGDSSTPTPIPYCLSIADDPAEGDGTSEYGLFDKTDPGIAVHPDDSDEIATGVFGRPIGEPSWCVLSDERVLDGEVIVQTMILDAAGDPRFY